MPYAPVIEIAGSRAAWATPIRAVAAATAAVASPGATVSANDIRPHLPTWVKTQGIGPAFGTLVRAGALRKVDWVVSTDSGTHGKPVGQYVVLGQATEGVA